MTTEESLFKHPPYHVKEVPNFVSFAEVPDVDIAVMAGRQHDAPVKGVGLQDKNFIVVTLKPIKAQTHACFCVGLNNANTHIHTESTCSSWPFVELQTLRSKLETAVTTVRSPRSHATMVTTSLVVLSSPDAVELL